MLHKLQLISNKLLHENLIIALANCSKNFWWWKLILCNKNIFNLISILHSRSVRKIDSATAKNQQQNKTASDKEMVLSFHTEIN